MTVRSSNTTITFQHPFSMPSVKGSQPAGTYRIFMDDDETPCIPFVTLRRIATHFHTPALSMTGSAKQIYSISAAELSAALSEDSSDGNLSLRNQLEIRL